MAGKKAGILETADIRNIQRNKFFTIGLKSCSVFFIDQSAQIIKIVKLQSPESYPAKLPPAQNPSPGQLDAFFWSTFGLISSGHPGLKH